MIKEELTIEKRLSDIESNYYGKDRIRGEDIDWMIETIKNLNQESLYYKRKYQEVITR